MLYEIEVRNFIKVDSFKKLDNFFQNNAKIVKIEKQEIIRYNTKGCDLKLKQENDVVKIVCQSSSAIQEIRPEMEVVADKKDFNNLKFIFS